MGRWNAKRRDAAARSSAAATGALIGTVVGGPGGGIVGAGAGVLLEPLMARMWNELAGDSRGAVASVLATAAEHGGVTVDQLAASIGRDEHTRLLGGLALAAGSRTRNRTKIGALGSALASGVLSEDDARLDEEQLVVRALDDMEAPHIRVLDIIARHVPAGREARPYVSGGTDEGAPTRSWTRYQLNEVLPGLASGMHGLLGTLQRHGLAVEDYNIARAFERYRQSLSREDELSSDLFSRRLNAVNRGRERLPQGFSVGPPEWQPTPLGERVLEYLMDAVNPGET